MSAGEVANTFLLHCNYSTDQKLETFLSFVFQSVALWRRCLVSPPSCVWIYLIALSTLHCLCQRCHHRPAPHTHTHIHTRTVVIPQGHWCLAAINVSDVAAGALYGRLFHPEQDLLRCVRRGRGSRDHAGTSAMSGVSRFVGFPHPQPTPCPTTGGVQGASIVGASIAGGTGVPGSTAATWLPAAVGSTRSGGWGCVCYLLC